MNIHRLYARLSPAFRRRRMRRFQSDCEVTENTLVLDVGGTAFNWTLLPARPRLMLLNYTLPPKAERGIRCVVSDARSLPFVSRGVPVVFSNSVIEHVGEWEDQMEFAAEIARVGHSYFVQTPNRRFPIEPHLLALFIHWLPKEWRA